MNLAWITLCGALICTSAQADCLDDAARFHHVNVRLAHAIATVESGQQPAVAHVNADGSTDIGLMQVNTRWLTSLSRFGITRASLYNGCTNAYVGTWILSQNIQRIGLTWDAVGAYNAGAHAKRVAYARRVYHQLMAASPSVMPDVPHTSSPVEPAQPSSFVARLFTPVARWEAGQ